ncbi:unnamed protein product [Lactuca saligna]|uniref:NB-ARC domain-containing protein n=1 Tax=Lactuca saligna TaxID=75948 RepID=A0AA35V5T0_LACSI|nr:unnamed protein product [Lactuca saligna]
MRRNIKSLNIDRDGVKEKMVHNERDDLEIPTNVQEWLEDVKKINEKVENLLSTDVVCCFNIRIRYKNGKRACKINEEIHHIMVCNSKIIWTDHRIPPGRIRPMNASTSSVTSSDHHDQFPSREHIFTEALNALKPDNATRMVALCGMGGVGKSKMVERLKMIVQERKMFDYWVHVVIGQETDLNIIQNTVAHYLGVEIGEIADQPARIEKILNRFKAISKGGEIKFLIILDDVCQRVDLNYIGLSRLSNEGVNFKVLLTSQDLDICNKMGVQDNLVLNVEVLTEAEAQSLFDEVVGMRDDVEMEELNKIGKDIVKMCGGLPGAIEKMAVYLKDKSRSTWKDTLSRLEQHDRLNKIEPTGFEKSLDSLEEETRSIFFLCGLFPSAIPTEELLRYAYGLKVFRVFSIEAARIRLSSSIEKLMLKNLLMESEDVSCIKMHDLMLSFVLNMVSKGKDASFVRYGSMPKWTEDDMSIYERIISTCEGMTRFPEDLKFPKLSFLKLMQGDESLSFPSYFYKEMKELKVIEYASMKRYPAIEECSIKLRVLHLHQCSLSITGCSSIGNLYNLEVLSFAGSNIQWLHPRIGNLKKLRLLDLTDCSAILIDEGVFKSLEKLEELYAIAGGEDRNAIKFTDNNLNGMAERSKTLSALEFEFFGSNAQLENISFEKLKRFKISVGRSLDRGFSKITHSYENTLQLVTNSFDVFKYKTNELFKETEVLCLSVADMNDLENIDLKSARPHQHSSFYNLKVLVVSECAELKYLFTTGVAKDLSKLEHLEVEKCSNMEELIHTNGSRTTIIFPKLKFLSLCGLPKLLGLCCNVNIIALPQIVKLQLRTLPKITNIYPVNNSETSCLLKKEIRVPNLEKLQIEHLENLKEIWPRDYIRTSEEEVNLREIYAKDCDNLVNLFPCNPMPLLHHLEELKVKKCGSIEELFNIDLDSIGQTGEGCNNSSLRNIQVKELGKLNEVWRIKGENNSGLSIRGFQAVETITITACTRFRGVFTPTTINFEMRAHIIMGATTTHD